MPRHLLGPNNKRVRSAVALGRLLCRHAYRYRPPEPGLDLSPGTAGLTIRNLASTEEQDEDDGGRAVGAALPGLRRPSGPCNRGTWRSAPVAAPPSSSR
jgi:hypothetical protein